MKAVAICSMLLSLTCLQTNGQAKKQFTTKDLPGAVREAFKKSYPDARINAVNKEVENGKTYFEIESVDEKTKRDILYTPDGQVYELEEQIAPDSLPVAVRNALESTHPHCTIVKAEATSRGSTKGFEVLVRSGKKSFEIAFDESGKILESKEVKPSKRDQRKTEAEEDDD